MLKKSIIAAGLMVLALSSAQAQDKKVYDKDSAKFVSSAIQTDIAEIDAGQLAQQKGKSQAIKEYGAAMVKEHSAHKDKVVALAPEYDVKPPTGSSLGQKATYAKLKVLSGDTFDRSFAKSMVSAHQSAIKMYQAESGKSDTAGALAKETLPDLAHHLEMAQGLVTQTTAKK